LQKLPDVPDAQKIVVNDKDTLWAYGKAALGDKANNGDIQKFVDAMIEENPVLKTPARNKPNGVVLIYPTEELKKPKAGSWGPDAQKPPAPPPPGTKADAEKQAEAAKAARAVEVDKYQDALGTFAENVSKVENDAPNIGQVVGQVREKLKEVDGKYPELSLSGEATYLRTRLPQGDAQKVPPPPKPGTPEAEAAKAERKEITDAFGDWSTEAKEKPLNRDDRIRLGAMVEQVGAKYPDLIELPPVKQLIADTKPLTAKQAEESLKTDMDRLGTAYATKKGLSNPERRDLGQLLVMVGRYAPKLKESPHYNALLALQPITPRAAMVEDVTAELKAKATAFPGLKGATEKDLAAIAEMERKIGDVAPHLLKSDEYRQLKGPPLTAKEVTIRDLTRSLKQAAAEFANPNVGPQKPLSAKEKETIAQLLERVGSEAPELKNTAEYKALSPKAPETPPTSTQG